MNSFQIQPPSFDLFDIFSENVLYDENTHSNIIAYFLGWNRLNASNRFPQYEDALKALFRSFAEYLPVPVDQMNFDNVSVERESSIGSIGRIDIFVKIPLANKKYFALVIENKIISFEHGNQLRNYYNFIAERYHENTLFIFLSPQGVIPSDSNYQVLAYPKLAAILRSISFQDVHAQAFMTVYSALLENLGERLPSNLQNYLTVFIKVCLNGFGDKVKVVGSFSDTWVDFEPRGWDEIVSSMWQGKKPSNGIWGFSFWITQKNGLSLELYFLEDERMKSFYQRIYEAGQKVIDCVHEPKRIGEGKSKWMSIYTRRVLSSEKLMELQYLYSQSPTQDLLSEIESKIHSEWTICMSELDQIYHLLQASQ